MAIFMYDLLCLRNSTSYQYPTQWREIIYNIQIVYKKQRLITEPNWHSRIIKILKQKINIVFDYNMGNQICPSITNETSRRKIFQKDGLFENNLSIEKVNEKQGIIIQEKDVYQAKFIQQTGNNKKKIQRQIEGNAIYEGEYRNQLKHGFGIMKWSNGARYQGFWAEGKANMSGKFYHQNGDFYQGQFLNDKKNGQGTLKKSNGAKYIGNWRNDLPNGKGIYKWQNGEYYEGQFKGGKKYGLGKHVWQDFIYYEGNWVSDMMEGHGTFQWSDGRCYKGEWRNNLMHGQGTYKWADGRRYEGQYYNNLKHGHGKYYWQNGCYFEGPWLNGKRHGKGIYVLANKHYRYGIWHLNKRTEWLSQTLKDVSQTKVVQN